MQDLHDSRAGQTRRDHGGDSLAVLGAGTFAGCLSTSISGGFLCLQENANLFKADKSSQIWLDYVGYMDAIVLDGFFRLVHKSLQLLLTNMAPDVGPGLPRGVVPLLGMCHHSLFGGQTCPSQCSLTHLGSESQRCRCPPLSPPWGTVGLGGMWDVKHHVGH